MLRKYVLRVIDDYMHKPAMTHRTENLYLGEEPCVREEVDYEENETIRFNLTPAVGGRILQIYRRNKHGDRESQTYVIPSGEDVGERVSKILNLELMK